MNRSNRMARRSPGSRERRKKFYIFCEGVNTEPEYIEAYNVSYCRASIEVIFGEGGADPSALVRRSIAKEQEISTEEYRDEFGDQDQVWAVFDRDDHEHYHSAIELASKNNVRIAASDPCFELWLVLHFVDYSSSQHRSKLKKQCEEVCPGYTADRKKVPDHSQVLPLVFDAERRSEILREQCRKAGTETPTTNVDELTRCMRSARLETVFLYNVCQIDDKFMAEKTPHATSVLVDVEEMNSSQLIMQLEKFGNERAKSLGFEGSFSRVRDLTRAKVALIFPSKEGDGSMGDVLDILDCPRVILLG